MPDPSAKTIISQSDMAFAASERANAEILWRQNATFMIPNQSGFLLTGSFGQGGTPQFKTTQRIFDSTAVQANLDLASALDGALTNPVISWASIEFENEALKQDKGPDGSAQWLTNATKSLFKSFKKSNLNIEKTSAYEMLCALGTMILFHTDKSMKNDGTFKGHQFDNVSCSECAWSENSNGEVNEIFRRLKLKARQAVERFGEDKVSEQVIKDLKINPDTLHDYVHYVWPRPDEDIDTRSTIVNEKKRAYGSIIVDKDTNKKVEESGYHEFPYYVVRFSTGPNEQIGRGPGHVAYADTATINAVKELIIQAGEQAVAPPMKTNDESVMANPDFSANTLIFLEDIEGLQKMNPSVDLNMAQFNFLELKESIQKSFLLDKIQFLTDQNAKETTAFEFAEHQKQRQKAFGPTTERLSREWLTPMVMRAFNMQFRGGGFGSMPPLLDTFFKQFGFPAIEISYINELARAQKIEQLSNIRQYVASAQDLAVASGSPEPMDRIDLDKVMIITEEVLGVPPEIVRNPKQIKAIRDAREEKQKQAEETENLLKTGDAISKLKSV